MVYDSQRGRTILFGGFNGNYLGDTWEWNGAIPQWTQMNIVGPKPSARHTHAMGYDSRRGSIILFGGFYNNYLGDTWELTPPADGSSRVRRWHMSIRHRIGRRVRAMFEKFSGLDLLHDFRCFSGPLVATSK